MKLFAPRNCWVPTRRGWLLIAVLVLAGVVLLAGRLNAFLSPTRPIPADVLVLEYWLPDSAMKDLLAEFRRGGYQRLVISGGPLPEQWQSQSRYKSGGELTGATLASMGLETNLMVVMPSPNAPRDRTYSMALGVKAWLDSSQTAVRAVNLYSLGPHARRSRLLYEKALGDRIKVGVIARPADDYDPNRWWSSGKGFHEVVGEALAYLYARILFHPGTA